MNNDQDIHDVLKVLGEGSRVIVKHLRWYPFAQPAETIGALMTVGDAYNLAKIRKGMINPQQPYSKGGATIVKFFTPDGQVLRGASSCQFSDFYNREEGRRWACGNIDWSEYKKEESK